MSNIDGPNNPDAPRMHAVRSPLTSDVWVGILARMPPFASPHSLPQIVFETGISADYFNVFATANLLIHSGIIDDSGNDIHKINLRSVFLREPIQDYCTYFRKMGFEGVIITDLNRLAIERLDEIIERINTIVPNPAVSDSLLLVEYKKLCNEACRLIYGENKDLPFS